MSLLKTVRGGKSVEFSLNGGVLMGTAPGCQIVVADPAAAPKHCRIARDPRGYVLTDLSGGTLVNGAKVKEHVLKSGDVIQIGSEKFTFAEKAAVPVAAAAGARAAASPGPARPAAAAPKPAAPRPAAAPAAASPEAPARKALPSRAAAGPRKLPARTGSSGRVHKDQSLFQLPSTPKGKAIALSVAIGLVVLVGALFMLSAGTVNSQEVVKKAQADWEEYEKIDKANFQKQLDKLTDMIANENYQKYAKLEIKKAEKAFGPVKQRVDLEKQADADAKPFLDQYKALKEDQAKWEAAAADRHERVVNLLDRFRSTSYEPQLEVVRVELREHLEKGGGSFVDELPKLTQSVEKRNAEKTFIQAWKEINEFGTKWKEATNSQCKKEMQELRAIVEAAAKRHISQLEREASAKGSKEESRKTLENFLPFVTGIPEAQKQLEKAIDAYK